MTYSIPYDWKFNANLSGNQLISGLTTTAEAGTFTGNVTNATIADPTTGDSSTLSTALKNMNSQALNKTNNYLKNSDAISLIYSTNGLSSDASISKTTLSENVFEIVHDTYTTMFTAQNISISDTKSSNSFSVNTPAGVLSLNSTSGSNNSNFLVSSQGLSYSYSPGSTTSSIIVNNYGVLLSGDQAKISSTSIMITSTGCMMSLDSKGLTYNGAGISLGASNISLRASPPSSNTDVPKSSSLIAIDGETNCVSMYASNSARWGRFNEDVDWQIGMVPYHYTGTGKSTSGTASTTSIALSKTSGYYLVNTKVVGKCATSGIACVAIFKDYALSYDGTTMTMLNGTSTVHPFGSVTSPSVKMSVSGTNLVITYNVTTSSSTNWTWSIAVEQKLAASY